MKNKKVFSFLILILVFVLAIPYVWVETNTCIFKNEFDNCFKQIVEIDGKEFICKVYYKTNKKAKLLYITNDGTFMSYYKKENNSSWLLEDYDILWSRYGSASEIFYPFYRYSAWRLT